MASPVNPTQSSALRAASHHLVTSPQRGKDRHPVSPTQDEPKSPPDTWDTKGKPPAMGQPEAPLTVHPWSTSL